MGLSMSVHYSTYGRRSVMAAVVLLSALVLLRVLLVDTEVPNMTDTPTEAEWPWSVLPQSSRVLVQKIRQEIESYEITSPYNLSNPNIIDFSQNGQSCFVASLFGEKNYNRTFLEAGAYDGEDLSNTLYLERELNWRGILVEPNPWDYWGIRRRKRRAFSLNACLSPNRTALKLILKQSGAMSRLATHEEVDRGRGIFTGVRCYPLFSVLLAANLTTLDYLALDLEGADMKILQTLPWGEVRITVLQVEASHLDPESERRQQRTTKKRTERIRRVAKTVNALKEVRSVTDRSKKNRTGNGKIRNSNIFIANWAKNDVILAEHSSDDEQPRAISKETNCLSKKSYRYSLNSFSNGQRQLISYLEEKGYTFVAKIGEDFIFTRKDLVNEDF